MRKLNEKEKELVVDNMFETTDTVWLEMSLPALKKQNIEIGKCVNGWYDMYVNGDFITMLKKETLDRLIG